MEPCITERGSYDPIYREEVIRYVPFDTKNDKHNYYCGHSKQRCALFLQHSTSEARSFCFIRCKERKGSY
jgi:hypothetical protein